MSVPLLLFPWVLLACGSSEQYSCHVQQGGSVQVQGIGQPQCEVTMVASEVTWNCSSSPSPISNSVNQSIIFLRPQHDIAHRIAVHRRKFNVLIG
ncbi:hypothetical protein B0I35DRAFT_269042 [Stachybotrys elegans]|uniref:Uncharacterized protein n=1 Tax=Stachybotrys elegans TaxID=80388 RepID=A0A8K0SN60_9HYPO|nr:hypothetical protein B0I35DRAFT_269042 [Stachybotrys elegans]